MKKLTFSMAIALFICLAMSVAGEYNSVIKTNDKFLRLHVIANSDSEKDQRIKLLVRDEILFACDEILFDCSSKEEAKKKLFENLDYLTDIADSVLMSYNQTASITLLNEEFDEREYDGFTLPKGEYDSLCIRIENAKGKNWWCICYPSLCLPSATSVDFKNTLDDEDIVIIKSPEKVRYKLWCYEFVLKIRKFLNSTILRT